MKSIKTRTFVKAIKTLDRAGNFADRTKNNVIKTKERAEETQNSRYSSPNDYATSNIEEKAEKIAHKSVNIVEGAAKRVMSGVRNSIIDKTYKSVPKAKEAAKAAKETATEANKTAAQSKAAVSKAKQNLHEVRQQGKKTIQEAKTKAQVDQAVIKNRNAVYSKNQSANAMQSNLRKGSSSINYADKNSAKNIKHSTKGLKDTSKGSVKTAKRTVKTAERSAKTALKIAKQTAVAAKRSAIIAQRVASGSGRLIRLAIGVMKMLRLAITGTKALIAIGAVGGKIALAVILVILLIGGMLGSVFGIFFSGEEAPDSGWTMRQAVSYVEMEFNDEIHNIIISNHHDFLVMFGIRSIWQHVIAIYAVRTATDPDNPMEVATMNEEKFELLRTIFWDINSITYFIETFEVEEDVLFDDGVPTGETKIVTYHMLHIIISHKSIDEITAKYGFSAEQIALLNELLSPEYISLWNALLFGVSSGVGSIAMVEVAISQIGNIGGEMYWRWYGFGNRVPWCAIFVSWVAEQNGFIQAGIIPRFAATAYGVQWFQSRGQWQPRGYIPSPGDLIFFDWTGDGNVQHVGIVERVEGNIVHTIEGNSVRP